MVGGLGFDAQGWEGLAQFKLIRTDKIGGMKLQKLDFFLDVLNV